MILKVLFCVFVLCGTENVFTARVMRRCYDCVSIRSCDAALQYVTLLRVGMQPYGNRKTFRNGICGYDPIDGRIPKVCCSDYTMQVSSTPKDIEIRYGTTDQINSVSSTSDPIETHPNLNLLPTSCGDIEDSRILNGVVAKLYEFPWMALIFYRTSDGARYKCAGTIINTRYILTAAHCVIDGETGVLKKIAGVRLGDYDYITQLDCQGTYQQMVCESKIQDIEVEEFIPHYKFNGDKSVGADIALLRLKDPINMDNNAYPICLPLQRELRSTQLTGLTATVAGRGITENDTVSSKLMKADIPIKSKADCSYYYPNSGYQDPMEKAFCAGTRNKDTCGGDSGGPLMIESDFYGSSRLVQYGIVSFGPSKCGSEYPGVYTDVTKYMEWILDNIKE